MGWKIVAFGFALIFRNPGVALRISIGPALLFLAWVTLVFRLTGVSIQMLAYSLFTGQLAEPAVLALCLILPAALFVSSWVAVAWHRFILADEVPGLLPAIHLSRVTAYTGRSILLGLLLILLIFPVATILGQILAILGLNRIPMFDLAFDYVLSLALNLVWLRLAIVLPATALGRDYPLSQGWNDGGTHAADLLSAAAVTAALGLVASRMLTLLALGGLPGLALQSAELWLTIMVNGAILSVVYGIAAERRRLP